MHGPDTRGASKGSDAGENVIRLLGCCFGRSQGSCFVAEAVDVMGDSDSPTEFASGIQHLQGRESARWG